VKRRYWKKIQIVEKNKEIVKSKYISWDKNIEIVKRILKRYMSWKNRR